MMASVASHKRVGLALAQCAMFEREMPHVCGSRINRGAGIQLNERVTLRRAVKSYRRRSRARLAAAANVSGCFSRD